MEGAVANEVRSKRKRTVFVGGIPKATDEQNLISIFSTFGSILDLTMPKANNAHKGYCFIEFESRGDAHDAVDNLNRSEIFGRTITVKMAREDELMAANVDISAVARNRPIWEDEEWIKQYMGRTLDLNKEETNANSHAKQWVVFMDISIDKQYAGRLIFRLRNDVVPRTAENFLKLALPNLTGRGNGYKQSTFHRVIPRFMAQGGDFTNHDGSGGRSIFGGKFEDENFHLKHAQMGTLSMANSGPNTNGSQFFVTFTKTEWLDGKHVVFGNLVEGFDVLRKIEAAGSEDGTTTKTVLIEDCGQLNDYDQ